MPNCHKRLLRHGPEASGQRPRLGRGNRGTARQRRPDRPPSCARGRLEPHPPAATNGFSPIRSRRITAFGDCVHSEHSRGHFQGLAVRGQKRAQAIAQGGAAMIFQCSDLERALRSPELMSDAKAHAEQCEHCRQELYLWGEISRLAPQLHHEWESPSLWPRIEADLVRLLPTRSVVPFWPLSI